jgi:antirestriction protein ArdC
MKIENFYQQTTLKIIDLMEKNGTDWCQPWITSAQNGAPHSITMKEGQTYTGGNFLITAIAQAANGYASSKWATFKGWKSAGFTVRKGQKATFVVYYGNVKNSENDDDSKKDFYRFAKSYAIFNEEQTDSEIQTDTTIKPKIPAWESHNKAEELVRASRAKINHDCVSAFYNSNDDFIGMPPKSEFFTAEGYYSTMFHELGHWTGHQTRLARTFGRKFGDNAYAAEELVAELAAAFLTVKTGVVFEATDDHAKYLNVWSKKLLKNQNAIFVAAAAAQKAADFILNKTKQNQTMLVAA